MEDILKEVLIKKCGDRKHDQVLYVENLPSKFLYEQTRKLVPRKDRDGWMDGTLTVDPNGEMIWTLLTGIEKSQIGDGGFVFWVGNRDSDDRLADIMRYVDMSFPRDQRIPQFVENAQMRGEMNTGPIAMSQIPRVVLPAPIQKVAVQEISPSPAPVIQTAPQNGPQQASAGILDKRKNWSEERKQKMRDVLAKARAARREKVAA